MPKDIGNQFLQNAPIPQTISATARDKLEAQRNKSDVDASDPRAMCARIQKDVGGRQLERYGVRVCQSELNGVPVSIYTPSRSLEAQGRHVLLNLHGGGFVLDSGSVTENVPVAALSGIKVVAAMYRYAPEFPFPAALDDAEAVFRELLQTHGPENIVVYGASAGAALAAELMVRLCERKLPMPAALGFFSGIADFSQTGDSEYFFASSEDRRPVAEILAPYIGTHEVTDPALSPLYADLSQFPPTLCISGTRDFLLSQTVRFHRALLEANVDAELVVFEGMPHTHWCYLEAPESDDTFRHMAEFFKRRLKMT